MLRVNGISIDANQRPLHYYSTIDDQSQLPHEGKGKKKRTVGFRVYRLVLSNNAGDDSNIHLLQGEEFLVHLRLLCRVTRGRNSVLRRRLLPWLHIRRDVPAPYR